MVFGVFIVKKSKKWSLFRHFAYFAVSLKNGKIVKKLEKLRKNFG